MRIFQVMSPTQIGQAADVSELDAATILADGDQAKAAGKKMLEDAGFLVRSINWGPTAKGDVELIAYVTKGAA